MLVVDIHRDTITQLFANPDTNNGFDTFHKIAPANVDRRPSVAILYILILYVCAGVMFKVNLYTWQIIRPYRQWSQHL